MLLRILLTFPPDFGFRDLLIDSFLLARFEYLAAEALKIFVLRNVTPSRLVAILRRFGVACCLQFLYRIRMAGFFEKSVSFYEAALNRTVFRDVMCGLVEFTDGSCACIFVVDNCAGGSARRYVGILMIARRNIAK
jgi:hypothetical protein